MRWRELTLVQGKWPIAIEACHLGALAYVSRRLVQIMTGALRTSSVTAGSRQRTGDAHGRAAGEDAHKSDTRLCRSRAHTERCAHARAPGGLCAVDERDLDIHPPPSLPQRPRSAMTATLSYAQARAVLTAAAERARAEELVFAAPSGDAQASARLAAAVATAQRVLRQLEEAQDVAAGGKAALHDAEAASALQLQEEKAARLFSKVPAPQAASLRDFMRQRANQFIKACAVCGCRVAEGQVAYGR